MKTCWKTTVCRAAIFRAAFALLILGFAGGCVVREAYAPPPPRYYYRTRVVYTPYGPQYVRERVYYTPVEGEPVAHPPPAVETAPPPIETAAAAQLHPLVAPIALYPDPLIAVVLPASTFPQQLQDASAWLGYNPNPPEAAIDAQPWAPSVKAIVHYPTVLAQLTRDMPWTQSLGSAFTSQPADVMAAIQQLRAQAIAEGNLVNTPQQVVVQGGDAIAIEPANPSVIYVPEYDPVTVYVGYHPLFFGGVVYSTGPWLVNGCYWDGGVIFVGDWHGGYYYRGGRWDRDYAWRADRSRYWVREARYGPPPRIDRSRYEVARNVRGREAQLHQGFTAHATQRHNVQSMGRAQAPQHYQQRSAAPRQQGPRAPGGREQGPRQQGGRNAEGGEHR
jgi:hypothetical protein